MQRGDIVTSGKSIRPAAEDGLAAIHDCTTRRADGVMHRPVWISRMRHARFWKAINMLNDKKNGGEWSVSVEIKERLETSARTLGPLDPGGETSHLTGSTR